MHPLSLASLAMRAGVYIDGFNPLRDSGLSRRTCELIEFKSRIGVNIEVCHFHGYTTIFAGARSSMP